MPNHNFTDAERQKALGARRANPRDPKIHYAIRVRRATKAALLAAGPARVGRLLDDFAVDAPNERLRALPALPAPQPVADKGPEKLDSCTGCRNYKGNTEVGYKCEYGREEPTTCFEPIE